MQFGEVSTHFPSIENLIQFLVRKGGRKWSSTSIVLRFILESWEYGQHGGLPQILKRIHTFFVYKIDFFTDPPVKKNQLNRGSSGILRIWTPCWTVTNSKNYPYFFVDKLISHMLSLSVAIWMYSHFQARSVHSRRIQNVVWLLTQKRLYMCGLYKVAWMPIFFIINDISPHLLVIIFNLICICRNLENMDNMVDWHKILKESIPFFCI